nr:hypothetical protein [Tanacetum cinerariifolium]
MRCMEMRKGVAKHGGDEANDLASKGVRWQLPYAARVVTRLFLGAQGDRVDACSGLAPQHQMTSKYFCLELGFNEKKSVRFSAFYLQKKRNLLIYE